jgi:hypothetical protein
VVKKRKKSDSLVPAIEHALDLGEFISYDRSWDFVQKLQDVKHKIDVLVKDGNAERAVSLYEIFLSGCYEKADEIDDSGGDLGMFFEDLFCAWINARQKAKKPFRIFSDGWTMTIMDFAIICFGTFPEGREALWKSRSESVVDGSC